MITANPYSQYQRMEVETSPGRLVILLYNGMLRFLHQAALAMEARHYEQQSEAITRAQRILIELSQTLDFEAGGEIAERLASVYAYCLRRLTEANVRDDLAALQEVTRLLDGLREAWVAAEQAVRRGQSSVEVSP